jgi:hypothetical protein
MFFSDRHEAAIIKALRTAPGGGLTESQLLPASGLSRPALATRLDDLVNEGLLKRGKGGTFTLSDELRGELDGEIAAAPVDTTSTTDDADTGDDPELSPDDEADTDDGDTEELDAIIAATTKAEPARPPARIKKTASVAVKPLTEKIPSVKPPAGNRGGKMREVWQKRRQGKMPAPDHSKKSALREIAPIAEPASPLPTAEGAQADAQPPMQPPATAPADTVYVVPSVADLIRTSIDAARSRGATSVTLDVAALDLLLA